MIGIGGSTVRTRARSFAGTGVLVVGLALALASPAPHALAQPVPERGLRLGFALELANGRMPLFPQDGSSRPKAREAFLVGGRLSMDFGVSHHLALEAAFASHAYLPRDLSVYEIELVPRVRFIVMNRKREWYVRPLVGAAFTTVTESHVGLAGGLGFGIRRQVTSQYDAFLEIGYRLRWFRGVDADFAARTWPSYGLRANTNPDALFCFLGVTMGIGITPGAD